MPQAVHWVHDRRGRRVGVILPLKEYERLLEDSQDRHDRALIARARKEGGRFVDAGDFFRDRNQKPRRR